MNPRTDFDRQFLCLVLPRLGVVIRLGAHLVREELESFTEASSRVLDHGRRMGATHLSPEYLAELSDWVDCQLLAAIDAGRQPGLITTAELEGLTEGASTRLAAR